METPKRYRHHYHYHYSYPLSLRSHYGFLAVVSVVLIAVLLLAFRFLAPTQPVLNLEQLSVSSLVMASLATFYRLVVAYGIALALSIPLSLLVVSTPKLERFLLPFFDVLQSVPVLAFFPLIVLVFIKLQFFEGAAIFVLAVAMLWNIVFSMIGGLKTVPRDINDAATLFGAKGISRITSVTLPAIFPYIVTGSLLAWAQGWNLIIVAEVLHNYIPGGKTSVDLFGLGSLLVSASYQGKNAAFVGGLMVMVLIIGTMNFFVWQRLLHSAEKFKFD